MVNASVANSHPWNQKEYGKNNVSFKEIINSDSPSQQLDPGASDIQLQHVLQVYQELQLRETVKRKNLIFLGDCSCNDIFTKRSLWICRVCKGHIHRGTLVVYPSSIDPSLIQFFTQSTMVMNCGRA